MTLRVGVVGCGGISPFHLRGWQRIPEVRVAALVDADPARAEHRRREHALDVPVYGTIDDMLAAEQPDVVDILTPPALHVEHCLAAARAGAHVVCQKPLAPTFDEAAALVATLANHPRVFVVHENHRYRPWFQDVLEQCGSGALGPVRFMRLEQHDSHEPPETFKVASERGVLLEYGVHIVDLVRALLGEPSKVTARTARINARVQGESLAHVVLEYPQATAVIEITWRASGVDRGSAIVLGEEGEAVWHGRLTRGDVGRYRVVRGSSVVRDDRRSPTEEYEEAFCAFQRALVDAILAGAPLPQPASDNLRTLAITFAAYEASRRGCPSISMSG